MLQRLSFSHWCPLALLEDHLGEDQKTKSEGALVLYQKHAERIRMLVVVLVIPGLRNRDERQRLSVLLVRQDWFPDLTRSTS